MTLLLNRLLCLFDDEETALYRYLMCQFLCIITEEGEFVVPAPVCCNHQHNPPDEAYNPYDNVGSEKHEGEEVAYRFQDAQCAKEEGRLYCVEADKAIVWL